MQMYDLIMKKKRGLALSEEEIHYLVSGYTNGEIKDYQMSAFLMAVCFQGMNEQETFALTMNMRDSGRILDLSGISGVKVDKHSTGGVGDKTTFVLLAVIASLGVPVAKMSGRGLGHTGGTIDKFDCFEGFSTELTTEEFTEKVNRHYIAVAGQSGELAPADKKMYALRDVTGTVDEISLIASSIMSKKLAAGCDAIVLDVTYGQGAFMKTKEDAEKLAALMVKIGKSAGKKMSAVITSMCEPLGYSVGNALEVIEAIEALKGNAPKDLMEVVFALGEQMLLLAGRAKERNEARKLMEEAIASGAALEKLKELVVSQGGNPACIDVPELFPTAPHQTDILSEKEGYVTDLDALAVGLASMHLGGGRAAKEDGIDLSVGVVLRKKCGDYVKKGDVLAQVHSRESHPQEVIRSIKEAYTIRTENIKKEPVIYRIICG
ncbi:MAG: pyrimidine-nucleoside phosphorylase [Eubacterium sp.]|nr:pyrimidine-nucleoside phosphorylase [Eubacterium sp.]